MDRKNLITEAQEVRVLFALQILDSTQALFYQYFLCMFLLHWHNLLMVKSSRFLLSTFNLSLTLWSFSNTKLYLLRTFSPWFISRKLKAKAFITASQLPIMLIPFYIIITCCLWFIWRSKGKKISTSFQASKHRLGLC